MRERIYELVGPAKSYDYASRAYDFFVVIIAFISLLPLVFGLKENDEFTDSVLNVIDIVTAYILLLDYTFRWITYDLKTGEGVKAFLKYPFTPTAIIDLLAILPTLNLLPQLLRFLRILRVVKVFRYSKNLVNITNACYREAKTLASVFIAVVIYMLTVALIVYVIEPESFLSYFDAVCWAATQLTSVTFSPSAPSSGLGRGASIMLALGALIVIALPAGVITAAYLRELEQVKSNDKLYFSMVKRIKVQYREYYRPSVWLRSNLKVRRYVKVTAACLVVSMVLYLAAEALGLPILTDGLAGDLVAFLLEPAAGIVAGFFAGILNAVFEGNVGDILYGLEYAAAAIVSGVLFPRRDSDRKALRILGSFVILTLCCGLIDFLVYGITRDFDYSAVLSTGFYARYLSAALPARIGSVAVFFESAVGHAIVLLAILSIVSFALNFKIEPSQEEVRQQGERALRKQEREKEDEEIESLKENGSREEALQSEYRELVETNRLIVQELAEMRKQLDELLQGKEE